MNTSKMYNSLLVLAICCISFSCKKNQQHEQDISKEFANSKVPMLISSVQKENYRLDESKNCGCRDHGGTYFTDISHYLGTCKSYCDRGLGFKCGSAGFYVCNDNFVAMCPAGHCPIEVIRKAAEREMVSSITFYEDNTVSLTFKKPLPEEEDGNNTFEIEEDRFISFPEDMRLNGEQYAGFYAIKGDYQIDRESGEYGQVFFKIKLVKEI